MVPETRYAKTADGVHIAYQVVGNGPVDVVWMWSWISNVDVMWEVPDLGPFLRALAGRYRLIVFDRRGFGVSDRPTDPDLLTLDAGMDDLRAVMDAAGSERAILFGSEVGGAMGCMFAAAHPDRVAGLLLWAAYARYREAADYPAGAPDAEIDWWTELVATKWGTEEFMRANWEYMEPTTVTDPVWLRAWARYSRLAATPTAIRALDAVENDIDVRAILGRIAVPTLVFQRSDDEGNDLRHSEFLASGIPGAQLVTLPGVEHPPFTGDTGAVLAEVDRFIDGIRVQEAEFDRVLKTVLFTDIVGSTEHAAAIGDAAWSRLVARHNELVRTALTRFRGVEVDTAGDGFLATFDGPARAVRCAEAIRVGVRALGIEIREGVHTGEVQSTGDKVGGMAVIIGARVAGVAQPGEVLVSQTVKDLTAGSGLAFEDAGEHELKGVPDRWRLYRVVGG